MLIASKSFLFLIVFLPIIMIIVKVIIITFFQCQIHLAFLLIGDKSANWGLSFFQINSVLNQSQRKTKHLKRNRDVRESFLNLHLAEHALLLRLKQSFYDIFSLGQENTSFRCQLLID